MFDSKNKQIGNYIENVKQMFKKYQHPQNCIIKCENFRKALLKFLSNPSDYPHIIYHETADLMVFYDGYPKSKIHLLLMQKYNIINSISDLKIEHIEILQKMKMTAQEIAQFLKPNKIRIGFHAIPSLDGLHLHIISEDMAFCKHKKHYNSFMTDFLVQPETVIELLRQGKQMDFKQYESLLKKKLEYNGVEFENLIKAKQYLENLTKNNQ